MDELLTIYAAGGCETRAIAVVLMIVVVFFVPNNELVTDKNQPIGNPESEASP